MGVFQAAGLAGAFALVACVEGEGVETGLGEELGVFGGGLLFDAGHGVADHDCCAFAIWRTCCGGIELTGDLQHERGEGDFGWCDHCVGRY